MKKLFRLLTALALIALAANCIAQVPAVSSFTGGTTFGSIDATDLTIGYSFTANANITVTALGVWQADTSVPFAQTHQVGLWSASGTLLASGTVLTTGSVTGSWRYVGISPVQLVSGQTYVVGSALTAPYSDNYTRVPAAGGSVATSALIALGASASSASASGFTFPNAPDATYLGRFGPNLIVTDTPAAPIPTISVWGLAVIIAGLVLVGLWQVRRRQLGA